MISSAKRSSNAPATARRQTTSAMKEILREVMNTVGKKGRLGESIRCVVSVSMLTEGWDAKHGHTRAGRPWFHNALLCEQVIGRALRRQSYERTPTTSSTSNTPTYSASRSTLTPNPFVAPPQKPRETVQVKAVRPERDALEIRFPRVSGYRVDLRTRTLKQSSPTTTEWLSRRRWSVQTETRNSGIIGEQIDLNLVHTGNVRHNKIVYTLTDRMIDVEWRKAGREQTHRSVLSHEADR